MDKLLSTGAAGHIYEMLRKAGHEVWFVGGCVRDAMLGIEPHDADLCTDASPEQMRAIFAKKKIKTIDFGAPYGTIGVIPEVSKVEKTIQRVDGVETRNNDPLYGIMAAIKNGRIVDITSFRSDGAYTDGRRPDKVALGATLEQDLARRDFTVNAMAWNPEAGLVDPYGGRQDLEQRFIRAVGDPAKRFAEDALRMMRAIRFAAKLGFDIEKKTSAAIYAFSKRIKNVSMERIREELSGIITSPNPRAVRMVYKSGLYRYFLDELKYLFDPEYNRQNSPYHLYDVGGHTVRAMECSTNSLLVRMTLLLHDVGKPLVRTINKRGFDSFHGHEEASAEMAGQILARLRFPKEFIRRAALLIRMNDRGLKPERPAVKRFLRKLGADNLDDFYEIARADALAHAPDAAKRTLVDLDAAYEIAKDVLSSGETYELSGLEINGRDAAALGYAGPGIGAILERCLERVICDPGENTREKLIRFMGHENPSVASGDTSTVNY